jgi:hypothetical protein
MPAWLKGAYSVSAMEAFDAAEIELLVDYLVAEIVQ